MGSRRLRRVKRIKKFKPASKFFNRVTLIIFTLVFAGLGVALLIATKAASGVCSTSDVIGSSSQTVSVPETAQYRLWVRMQVPDTTNTGNLNGVRVELDGSGTSNDQCFTVTTTSSSAVNQWRWVNSSATASSTAHITSSLPTGNYTARILGLKAGVKVDKVLLLKSDNTCTPDNIISGSRQPGDNCTTAVPEVSFTASPGSVQTGTGSTLTWSATNADSCSGTGGIGGWAGSGKPTSGTFKTGSLTSNQTYHISCEGVGGTAQRSVTIDVTAAPQPTDTTPPTVTMNITGQTVTSGQQTLNISNQKSVTWRPTVTDSGSGVKSTTLTVNGQSVSLSNESYVFGNQAGGNGDYALRVVAVDNANNTITVNLNVRLRHPDINRNGTVDIFDLSGLLARWQTTNNPGYDLNRNGVVDIFDLSSVLSNWGSTQ